MNTKVLTFFCFLLLVSFGAAKADNKSDFKYHTRNKSYHPDFFKEQGRYLMYGLTLLQDDDPVTGVELLNENFEGNSSWIFVNDTNNKWAIGEAVNNGGTSSLYVSNDNGVTNAYAISGAQVSHAYKDVTFPAAVGEVSLQFDWRCNGEGTTTRYDYFRVWIVPASYNPTAGVQTTVANSTGVQLGQVAYNLNETFLSETVVFNATDYAGLTMRLLFEWRNDGSGGNQPPAALDNIRMTTLRCSAPSDLILQSNGSSAVDVSWSAPGVGGGNYELYLATTQDAPDESTTPTVTSNLLEHTFDNLMPSTPYSIWIRTNCGTADGSSLWKGPLRVTTTQIPDVLPFVEDFEEQFGWTFVNDTNNQWVIGEAVNNGGTSSLYVSNDNGITNAYTISGAQVSHAYRDLVFPDEVDEISLQFDWRSVGESSYDYIRVWLVPITYNPVARTQTTVANSGGVQLGRTHYSLSDAFGRETIVFSGNAYAGTTMRLMFEWRNDGGTGVQPPAALDNIEIKALTCSAPSALTAGVVTAATIDVSWEAPTTGGGNYDVYLATDNQAPSETATPTATSTETSYTFNDLTASTNYYVWVRTNCGAADGVSFWAGPVAVTTLQIPVAIPYFEDFEGQLGWSFVNDTNNQWVIGEAVNNGGTSSLYVSNDNGVTNAYTTTSVQVSHVYRDLVIPDEVDEISLQFDWRSVGESSHDYIRVWWVPITYNPAARTQTTVANSGGVQLGRTHYSLSNAFGRENIVFDGSAFAGTTMRLVFEWRNDGGGGNQPPAALDNIEVKALTCSAPSALTAGVVTAATINVSWEAPTTGGGNYDVYLATDNQAPSETATPTATSTETSYTFNDLTASTNYYVWVRTNCGVADGVSFWTGPVAVTTLQIPVAIPYVEDFEGQLGWSFVNDTNNQWVIGEAVNNGGTSSLYVSNDNGVTNAYTTTSVQVSHVYRDLVIPDEVDEISLQFDWRSVGESSHDYIRVWLVPITYNPVARTQTTVANSGGVQLGRTHYSLSNAFERETIVFSGNAYAGTTMRLVFEWRNDGSTGVQPPAALDNINVALVACSAPADLTLDDLTFNSMEVSWVAPATGGGNYDLYLTEGNELPDENTVPTATATVTTFSFDNLTPNTAYKVWVRTNCGIADGTSFWIGPLSVITTQIPEELPFDEGFEGTHSWTLINANTNKWFVGGAVHNGGANALYISNNDGVANAYTTSQTQVSHAYRDVIIPADASELFLEFDWRSVGESSFDYIRVWLVPVSYNPVMDVQTSLVNSGGVQLGLTHYSLNNEFRREALIFDGLAYAGTTMRLVFEWRNDGGSGAQPPAAIDNVSLSLITCSAPNELTLTAVTENTVDVSWQAPASIQPGNSYEVYLSESDTNPEENTTPTGNTTNTNYSFTGLNPNTVYYVWVRTNCGTADGTSLWAGPIRAMTSQIPAGLPYEDNFEGTNDWGFLNASTNKWIIGNAINNGGTRSLYITNDDGITNAYTTSGAQVSHAFRDIAIQADVAEGMLNFDWRAVGESTHDYVRVWLVPVTYQIQSGTQIVAGAGRQQIAQLNQQGNFTSFQSTVDLEPYADGILRLVFEWRNDGSSGTQPPGAIDNVSLVTIECPAVSILGFCETADSLDFYWERRAEEIGWEIAFEETDAQEPDAANVEFVTETGKVYENLLEETTYYFFIRTVCEEGVYGPWQKIEAATSNLSILGAEPFCAGPEGIIFPNEWGTGTVAQRNTYGRVACLTNTPSAVWYFLRIDTPGDLVFDIIQNTSFDNNGNPNGRGLDVDFAAFGPFDDLGEACRNINLGACPPGVTCGNGVTYPIPELSIVDCNYSGAAIEQMRIYGAVQGQIYAVLITNYNGDQGFIKLVQTNVDANAAGTTDCKFLCEVDLGEDRVFCEGEEYIIKANISAAGSTDDMTYTWFKDGELMDEGVYNTDKITVSESGVYRVLVEKDLCELNPTDEIEVLFLKPYNSPIEDQISLCDLENLGTIDFDLRGFGEAAVALDATPENLTFNFYHSREDLVDERNEIDLSIPYASAGQESVYLKIKRQDLKNCYFVQEIRLRIKPTYYPVTDFSYPAPICINNIDVLEIVPVEGFTEGGVFSYSGGIGNDRDRLKINSKTGLIDVASSEPGDYIITYTYYIPSGGCGTKTSSSTALSIFDRFEIGYTGDCVGGKYYLRVVDLLDNLNLDSSTYEWEGPGSFTANTREVQVNETGVYRVYFETASGCYESLEIDLEEIDCMIQKGISPNGDGLNDYFDLSNYDVLKFTVHNRYGTEVYTHGLEYSTQWYGQDKQGNLLPDGTYFYQIVTLTEVLTGWVQINK